jgi:hypothetical protein
MERHEHAKCLRLEKNTDANRVRGAGNPTPFKSIIKGTNMGIIHRLPKGTLGKNVTIRSLGGEIGNVGRKEIGGHRPNPRLRQTSKYLTKANTHAHVPYAHIVFERPKRNK